MGEFHNIGGGGGGAAVWKSAAANVAALPAAGNTVNDRRVVQDDGDGNQADYIWNGAAWVKMADVDTTIGLVENARHGTSISDLNDASPLEHIIYGVLVANGAAQPVNGTPTTHAQPDINRHHGAVEVTTLNAAGTLRITGTSYDSVTQTTTPGDTEDIVVGATGWYVTTKYWDGTPVWSSVGGLDVIADFYAQDVFPKSTGRTLQEIHINWGVTGSTNSMRVLVQKWGTAGGLVTIWDDTIANITLGTQGHNHVEDLSELIPADGSIMVSLFTQRVVRALVEFGYNL